MPERQNSHLSKLLCAAVAQFAAGLAALARQLEGLGLTGRTALDPRSSAATLLMAMYEQMGNALARQARPARASLRGAFRVCSVL